MTHEEIGLAVKCLDSITAMMDGDLRMVYVDALSVSAQLDVYEENYLAEKLRMVVNRRLKTLMSEVYNDLSTDLACIRKSKKNGAYPGDEALRSSMYSQQLKEIYDARSEDK